MASCLKRGSDGSPVPGSRICRERTLWKESREPSPPPSPSPIPWAEGTRARAKSEGVEASGIVKVYMSGGGVSSEGSGGRQEGPPATRSPPSGTKERLANPTTPATGGGKGNSPRKLEVRESEAVKVGPSAIMSTNWCPSLLSRVALLRRRIVSVLGLCREPQAQARMKVGFHGGCAVVEFCFCFRLQPPPSYIPLRASCPCAREGMSHPMGSDRWLGRISLVRAGGNDVGLLSHGITQVQGTSPRRVNPRVQQPRRRSCPPPRQELYLPRHRRRCRSR